MSQNGAGARTGVFAGKSFFVSAKVPSRHHYIGLIKEHGGTVSPLERESIDYRIADDLKDKRLVGNYFSYKFIERCIKMGVIVSPNDYRVGISPEQNSSSQAAGGASAKQKADDKKKAGRTVRSRVPFSKSDDLFLLNSLANNGSSANTAGNALYKEMARKEPHHTMHSWRSRWYEHLKNIVPEDDLWGPNPCYGDNATRKPGPLAVTRMRVADRGSDSEEGNTSRRRSSGVNRRQSNQDTLQKQRLQARQQQNEDFEQEALAREEEEQRSTGQTRQIKKPPKSKFSLADDNQLAVLHSVIPTLPDAKKIAMFSKLAKKFPHHTAEEWQNRYNTHTVPEANKALLFLGEDEGEGQDTGHEEDYKQPELQDQLQPRAPATGGRQPSPELGLDEPQSTFDESAIDPELLAVDTTAGATTLGEQTADTTVPEQHTVESLVEDVDSVARAFGHYRKITRKAKVKQPRSSDANTHTPERQIRHEVANPPKSPSGHGLKEVEQEEPPKLSTPKQPFSPSSNREILERLRSSPVNQSPSLQRRRRQSTPQAQISSPVKKAPKSPKGHPVTSPPASPPAAKEQITLTTTTSTTKKSKTTNVHQWLGDVEESDSQIHNAKATTTKHIPAALQKYHKIAKKRARVDESTESIVSSDQKRLRKDAAGTKVVRSATPEAPLPTPTPAPTTAQQTITPPVTQSQPAPQAPITFQLPPPPPGNQRTPEPVAPIAPMVASEPSTAPVPAPTPAPRRSGRAARKAKEPTPPPPAEEDTHMSDAEVAEAEAEPEPAPVPAKRGRGRPPKTKKAAPVPAPKPAPAPTKRNVNVKDMSTQDLYALADSMDQTGDSLIPVDQSTQRGNDTAMSFEQTDKNELDTHMEEVEEEEEGEDEGKHDDEDEEQVLDDYIKTVAMWRDKYKLDEKVVLDVIVMCSKVEELIVKVLESLSKKKGIPNIPGVWSKEDDKELQSGSAQAIEKMARKHGQENIDIRYEYLNSINTFNSSKRG